MHQLAASPGAAAILRERLRQIVVEGWTPDHDARHTAGELAAAAAAYAEHAAFGLRHMTAVQSGTYARMDPPGSWPWDVKWWKPSTPERDLEKAGGLTAAQLDVLKGGVLICVDMGREDSRAMMAVIVPGAEAPTVIDVIDVTAGTAGAKALDHLLTAYDDGAGD